MPTATAKECIGPWTVSRPRPPYRGEDERNLHPGDHVLIPAHRAHWVTWTAKDQPSIWLAIHFT